MVPLIWSLILALANVALAWPRFKALQQTTTVTSSSSTSASSSSTTSSATSTTNIAGLVEKLANRTEPDRYRLNVVYALLQTNCGSRIKDLLSEQGAVNRTVFLPVDEAFGSLSGIIRGGGLRLDCRGNCTKNPFAALAGDQKGDDNGGGGDMLQNVLSCLPEMMAYHVVQNASIIFNTTNMTFIQSLQHQRQNQNRTLNIANVTVLETALNSSSALVEMDQNQVLIANSTNNATFLNYGYQDPAMVISEPLNATDGTVYLINRFLLPPLPLNATLLLANQTLFLNNSLNALDSSQNYSNLTMFVPLDQAICPQQQGNCTVNLNATDYIAQGVLYANATLLNGTMVENLSNQKLQVNMTQEFNVTVNGTPVAIPNVPFAGGVIHFLNGTISTTSTASSSTTSVSAESTTAQIFTVTALPIARRS